MQRTILGTMQTQSPCPDCHGEGKVISEQCPHCHGEGVERKEEIVTVNIPAGVADGMTLSMSGKGNAARRGGVTGDLLSRSARKSIRSLCAMRTTLLTT